MHHRRCHVALSLATLALLVLGSAFLALGFNPTRSFGVAKVNKNTGDGVIISRRRLSRLGSRPPSCWSKCGPCSPCKAVHIPVQPGLTMPLEYYPEAWRCRCGNRLFNP